MRKAPLYLLSGGQSSRFGSDKARALFQQQPLLQHAASVFSEVSTHLFVIASRADDYADLGFETLGDVQPHLGPLGGLWTALLDAKQRQEGWFWLTSCDLLGVQQRWLDELLDARRDGQTAVAYRGDFWEPMPGLYHTSLLPHVERQLETGRRSLQRLLSSSAAHALALPEDWHKAAQINTPEALREFSERTAL